MVPLSLLNAGEEGEIVEIYGGDCSHSKICGDKNGQRNGYGRAGDLGLRLGKKVEMLQKGGRGPVLVKVDESRIALGQRLACKIMVQRKKLARQYLSKSYMDTSPIDYPPSPAK